MQLKTITNVKDIPFPGVEFIKTDKAITEIIIGKLRIRKGESYSPGLQVLVEAPFDEVSRFRMTAKIDGFDPKVSYHETKYDAETAGNKLADKGADITVDQVEVLVDDAGDVVAAGEGKSLPVADPLDAIPF